MISVCLPFLNLKAIFLVSFLSIITYTIIFLTQLQINDLEDLQEEALRYSAEDVRYAEMYRKRDKLSSQLKYVLLWTSNDFAPFPNLENRQKAFIKNRCPEVDCYVTNDRNFFGGELLRFDAIAFNGRNLDPTYLPNRRYDHQKYIYVNIESAQNYPVCSSMFDNYFNWTYTYKLKSDILVLYIQIRNKDDEIVGPKVDMKWINTSIDGDILNDVKVKWQRKNYTVAWMASNCKTSNNREGLVRQIKAELNNANLSLSVFGLCGKFSCSRDIIDSSCWNFLERNYYFYLAFENSHCEDYVTEKLLNPLNHFMIPIVYGGANYSRFLPPGSYLDASKLSPKLLVEEMSRIMSSEVEYMQYFKWRSVYKYTKADTNNVCGICSALHNKTMIDEKKAYKDFRKWWNPEYKNVCSCYSYPSNKGWPKSCESNEPGR